MLLADLALGFSLTIASQAGTPPASRFTAVAPLPGLPAIQVDSSAQFGFLNDIAREKQLQARMMWIDCTANLDRYNTEAKIVDLVAKIKSVGFNTIVFDVKPISGQVVWNSKLAPKLTEWRGRTMPAEFDPVPIFSREAKRHDLDLYLALNAFSEGHRNFKIGPGYAQVDQQTVLYETENFLQFGTVKIPLSSKVATLQPDRVAIFPSASAPQFLVSNPNIFSVTVNKQLQIVDGFIGGGIGAAPTPPRNGYVLIGSGTAAEKLRDLAVPGVKIELVSEPVFVPISERPEQQIPLMMNPHDPRVRAYAQEIAKELTANYSFTGLIYDDRLRYAGLNADFSLVTREKFEKYVGRKLQWPQEVFEFTMNPDYVRGIKPGPFYDAWMSWRPKVLQDFLREIRTILNASPKPPQLGVYSGSWYGEYPSIGSNWASSNIDSGFWFANTAYQASGFANLIDFFITGCYYPTATIQEGMMLGRGVGSNVEAAATLTNRLINDETWTYAGIMLADYDGNMPAFSNALQAAVASSQGVMVFDLSHNIDQAWPVFSAAFKQFRASPNRSHFLKGEAQSRRRQFLSAGGKIPPVIISAGSVGTGQ